MVGGVRRCRELRGEARIFTGCWLIRITGGFKRAIFRDVNGSSASARPEESATSEDLGITSTDSSFKTSRPRETTSNLKKSYADKKSAKNTRRTFTQIRPAPACCPSASYPAPRGSCPLTALSGQIGGVHLSESDDIRVIEK